MSWNKEGLHVNARYLGEFACVGTVVESRVAYGGKVLHTIQLDEPIMLPFCSDLRDVVIVDDSEIIKFDATEDEVEAMAEYYNPYAEI